MFKLIMTDSGKPWFFEAKGLCANGYINYAAKEVHDAYNRITDIKLKLSCHTKRGVRYEVKTFGPGLPCIECLSDLSEELYDYLPEDKRGNFK